MWAAWRAIVKTNDLFVDKSTSPSTFANSCWYFQQMFCLGRVAASSMGHAFVRQPVIQTITAAFDENACFRITHLSKSGNMRHAS